MARLSDSELVELKDRVIKANSTGSTIAKSGSYLLALITEVQELRSSCDCQQASPAPKNVAKKTLHITEMTVTHIEEAKPPVEEKAPEPLIEAKSDLGAELTIEEAAPVAEPSLDGFGSVVETELEEEAPVTAKEAPKSPPAAKKKNR